MTNPSLWQNRNFCALFAAAAATNLGDGVMALAVPWLATLLTQDPFLIGLVAAARSLPWLLFALPAGVITDRHDHRRLLIGADALRVALSLGLLGLALTAAPGTGPVLAMAGLAFVLGSAEVVRDNTAQTFLPSVVDQRHLEQANGALWSTEQLAGQFIGPPLAGVLIGLSVALPFGLHAGLLALGIGLTLAMAVPRREVTAGPVRMWASLREGMGWLWRHVMLRRLALILGGFNFLGYGLAAILVLYGQRVLGLDAVGYGGLLTLAACGGLTASLIGPRILRHIRPATAILTGMCLFTATAAVMALRAPMPIVAAMMVLDGFGGMMWNIAQVSYRQRHIPPALLGRVNAAFRFLGTGPAAFGAFAFGALVGWGEGVAQPGVEAGSAVLLPYAVAAGAAAMLTAYAALRLRLD